jgi:hypothetical protein
MCPTLTEMIVYLANTMSNYLNSEVNLFKLNDPNRTHAAMYVANFDYSIADFWKLPPTWLPPNLTL